MMDGKRRRKCCSASQRPRLTTPGVTKSEPPMRNQFFERLLVEHCGSRDGKQNCVPCKVGRGTPPEKVAGRPQNLCASGEAGIGYGPACYPLMLPS